MARTWGEIKTFVAESLHQDETDAVLSTNLLPRWAERTLDRIRTYTYWRWDESQMDLTWAAQANSTDGSTLYLPSHIYRLRSLYPQSLAARRTVAIISPGEFDVLRPRSEWGWDYLVVYGYYGVEADNPSAGVITVTPDGAGTANQNVVIEGLDANNRDLKETVTVDGTGTTPVNTTGSFRAGEGGVRNVFLSGAASGATVTISRAGTTLQVLNSSTERVREHLRTSLFAQIGGSGTYTCRYWRRLIMGTPVDTDLVPCPQEFHDLLETGMMEQFARWRGDLQMAMVLEGSFTKRLRELVKWDRRDPGVKRRYGVKKQWGRSFR